MRKPDIKIVKRANGHTFMLWKCNRVWYKIPVPAGTRLPSGKAAGPIPAHLPSSEEEVLGG